MAKADRPDQRREGFEEQQVKAPTDHRGNGLNKSRGNEVSKTGRSTPARATVGLDEDNADEIVKGSQNAGGGSRRAS
jgi:hypothetical protein